MGDMLVAHEDDIPKDRGLKVSGHCALDTGLGWGNTFATHCMQSSAQPKRGGGGGWLAKVRRLP